MTRKLVVFIRSVAFIAFAVVVGWNTSVWAKAHDQGVADELVPLTKPLDVIGQLLIGEEAFGASVTEVDDMQVVQIDIGGPEIVKPTLISVLDSNCQTVAQVLVGGDMESEIIREDFYPSLLKPCEEPGGDR